MKDKEFLKQNGVDLDKALELFGEMELYNETVGDFLNEITRKVENLTRFKELSDMDNYAIIVHSIKSDARYLGFTFLGEMAYDHELKSKAKELDYVVTNFNTLLSEIDKMISICETYLGQEPTKKIEEVKEVKLDKAILVVDDSNLVTNFIEKIFGDTLEVIKAYDGEQAIKVLEGNPNKLLGMLLDLNMPNVDGFSVLDYMTAKGLFTSIPVSIITGGDDRDTIHRIYNYPVVDVLTKPFNERDVKRVVEKMSNLK